MEQPQPQPPQPPQPQPRFPLFIDLHRRAVAIVGGGNVAARRVGVLLGFGARIRVISPEICPKLQELCDNERVEPVERGGPIEWIPRKWRAGDLDGAALAVAATDDREVNHAVWVEAASLSIPVSVADRQEECSFFFPAIACHGSVVAGISSAGLSPAQTAELARRLREVWPEWVADTQRQREGRRQR